MSTILVSEVKLPTFEMPQMARDFGLDITIPDGGLVSSAANQKQYKAECGRIYKEFMVTMGDYFQEEEGMKQELQKLNSQKNSGSRVGYNPVDDDAVSENMSEIFTHDGSRRGGFVTRTNRPQTVAGMSGKRLSVSHLPNRPSTVAEYTKGPNVSRRLSYPHRRSSAQFSAASADYDGVMDHKSLNTRDRKLKMNSNAFSKLLTGRVNIKLQHKDGEFVLKQVLVDSSRPLARDAGRAMEMKDKIALVRKKTNFKSPTLSSDLKINNLVAIQKSLQGLPAKRISVGEIMEKAKDRRARLFKVEVSSANDIGGIYNSTARYHTNDTEPEDDDISTVPSHDGVQLVKVEARKRRNSSSCSFSQDGVEMRNHKESFLTAHKLNTPRSTKLNIQRRTLPSASQNMYLDTSVQKGEDLTSEKSESGSPRVVTAREVKALVKHSMDEDRDREHQLNRWRQRMTFAAVKRNGLGRILSGAGLNSALR